MISNTIDSGNIIFVRCSSVTGERFVTASCEHQHVLSQHRWRVINDVPVTTLLSGSLEYKHTIDYVLYGTNRTTFLTRRDNNPMNCIRENVRMSPGTRENVIVTKDAISYLLLPNAQTVLIDTTDVELISHYLWYSMIYRNSLIIISRYADGGLIKKIQLSRLIMGVNLKSSHWVKHKNQDKLDCRRDNLYIED